MFVLCQFFLLGFTENNVDNLYSYQWGLKNDGNFFVDRSILANDYIPLFFSKNYNDQMFFDDRSMIDYLKSMGNSYLVAYANSGFDTNWEWI